MKSQKHLLADVWESFPDLLSNKISPIQSTDFSKHLMDMVALGPYYYYLVHVNDYSVSQCSASILSIHGLKEYPQTIQQIMDWIHPDDLAFVIAAETATINKMIEIGFEHQLNLKNSYCFRMKTADGTYKLFHHQAIHLSMDDDGKLLSALNIHTEIDHITKVNLKTVLVSGIGDRKDYCQLDVSSKIKTPQLKLSKREMQILSLLAVGLNSRQIADDLFISEDTVRTHRKNLLKKTNTNSCVSLIKACLEAGLI